MKKSGAVFFALFIGAVSCGALTGCDAPPNPDEATGKTPLTQAEKSPASSVASSLAIVQAPRILDFGPHEIHAGVAFYKQSNGQSAVWVRMSESLEGTDAVILINGTVMQSAIQKSQITALVPDGVYATPGELALSVVQHKDGAELRSGPVKIVVR